MGHGVVIRLATAADAGAVADVLIRSRHASIPAIPPPVHPDDEMRRWVAESVVPRGGTWVAEGDKGVVALLVLDGDWIGHLYVDPDEVGKGIGSRLVAFAKSQRPNGLDLWAFQSNAGARRFYERHGFVAIQWTDGENEEGAPDVRYHWAGEEVPVRVEVSVAAMLAPDTKDWTWVLERPCPECGFDAGTHRREDVAGLVRTNVARWRELLAATAIRPGRRNPATWSTLEYAAHVRDVYRRYDERVALMLAEDDPPFANWDQDASAIAERYDAQDPGAVVAELALAGEAIAIRLDGLPATAWTRPGRRSDGASFTVATIALYMVHDPIHHLVDVERQLG